MTWLDDLRSGLAEAFETDERVHLLGEDVMDPYGGSFKVTQGLSTRFPARVHTTPIAEGGIVGVGIGMAVRGLRPVIELMFGDFLTLTIDQLVNGAAKFTSMFGYEIPVPIVVRTPMGGGRGYGPTHSQSIEKLLLGVPGLKVIAPSVFHDPGDEIKRAIADDSPVLFVEHKLLYTAKSLAGGDKVLRVSSAADANCITVRNFTEGAPDVSVVCYGGASLVVADVMRRLAPEEIRVEAIVPADISSTPIASLTGSIARTGRLLVVDEATPGYGWAAETAAAATSAAWSSLTGPVHTITSQATVIPATRSLEEDVLLSTESVEGELLACLG